MVFLIVRNNKTMGPTVVHTATMPPPVQVRPPSAILIHQQTPQPHIITHTTSSPVYVSTPVLAQNMQAPPPPYGVSYQSHQPSSPYGY